MYKNHVGMTVADEATYVRPLGIGFAVTLSEPVRKPRPTHDATVLVSREDKNSHKFHITFIRDLVRAGV